MVMARVIGAYFLAVQRLWRGAFAGLLCPVAVLHLAPAVKPCKRGQQKAKPKEGKDAYQTA